MTDSRGDSNAPNQGDGAACRQQQEGRGSGVERAAARGQRRAIDDACGEGEHRCNGKGAQRLGRGRNGGNAFQPPASQIEIGAMMIGNNEASTCRPTA